MISTQDSQESSSLELPLPPGFEKIEDIMSMPSERLQKGPLVNVIGLVQDYQPPIPTNGLGMKDFKCTITIVDLSTQIESGRGVKVMIFWPQDKMPHISGVRDVVLLRKFKVQMWSGYVSLLVNWASDMRVFPAAKMCLGLLPKAAPSKSTPPSPAEVGYAGWLFHHIDNGLFPDTQTFQERTMNAMVVKDKYSLLKDVKAGNFYDLIGEVIRVYERDGRVTLYLSDYTAHSLFYRQGWGEEALDSSNRDGDEYGYTKSKKKSPNDWPGPYGKLSIQITVYDSHAAYIREQVKNGDWVILRNVQVKMGNQGGCIEGFLRGDRGGFEGKVQVQIIRRAEDAERNDIRWKDGLRRKKEWWDRFKKQKQGFLAETQGLREKHHLDDAEVSKSNGKKRRKEMRAAAEQKFITIETKLVEKLDLNSNVKCNHPDKPPTPLATILNTTSIVRSSSGSEYVLPFQNIKHRSNVCIIDFWPNKLEDFAVGRRVSEYEVLSDYSGGESTDNEEDMRLFREGKGYGGEKAWEWRFALRVQDADKKARSPKESIWLIVDNQAGHMLLNMDAVNLRQDEEALAVLREVLFRLWGDLEEKKSTYLKERNRQPMKATGKHIEFNVTTANGKASHAQPGDDFPPDSDEEITPRSKRARGSSPIDIQGSPLDMGQTDSEISEAITFLPITNKGFTCCIQQYGIKVPEESHSKADAGDGFRWKRVFGLFGTMIA